jgi:hypothetical protein
VVDFIVNFSDYLQRRFVILVGVFSGEIVAGLIACNPPVEVLYIFEVFPVIKLSLDSTMHGFNIAVVAPCPWRYAFVYSFKSCYCRPEAVAGSVLSEAADEL